MQDTLHHFPPSLSLPKPNNFPSLSRPRKFHLPAFSSKTTIPKPPKIHDPPSPSPPPSPISGDSDGHDEFEEKMLFLDSIGIDIFSVISDHPQVVSASLSAVRSTVGFMSSLGLNEVEFRRIVSMCPEVLTAGVADLVAVLTFLLREAGVKGSDLKRVLHRRPRLLASSVEHQLRPTLTFLRTTLGLSEAEIHRHTHLLSSSVENNLLPRIRFFENIGFSESESMAMFRKLPQLFCLSVKECYEPKLNYFVVVMGRGLKELREFPEYFSYSLENRIKPRHQSCVEKGVFFTLPVLLKTSQAQFRRRLEVCCNTSLPLKTSPLWCVNPHVDSDSI